MAYRQVVVKGGGWAELKDLENSQRGQVIKNKKVCLGEYRVWPSKHLVRRLLWMEGSQMLF